MEGGGSGAGGAGPAFVVAGPGDIPPPSAASALTGTTPPGQIRPVAVHTGTAGSGGDFGGVDPEGFAAAEKAQLRTGPVFRRADVVDPILLASI